MKIFANFDTTLASQGIQEAQERYGVEHVLFVRRDSIYLFLRLSMPLVLWLFLFLIFLYGHHKIGGLASSFTDSLEVMLGMVMVAMTLYIAYIVWDKVMDYYMDYVIITPKQIIMFDQDGILKRETRSLGTEKIKTINIVSDGLWCSVFKEPLKN